MPCHFLKILKKGALNFYFALGAANYVLILHLVSYQLPSCKAESSAPKNTKTLKSSSQENLIIWK